MRRRAVTKSGGESSQLAVSLPPRVVVLARRAPAPGWRGIAATAHRRPAQSTSGELVTQQSLATSDKLDGAVLKVAGVVVLGAIMSIQRTRST
jgi:hypothetical protein